MITANSIDADVGIVIVFNIVVAVFDNSDDEKCLWNSDQTNLSLYLMHDGNDGNGSNDNHYCYSGN